jgi:hypothetical protein
MHVFLNLVDKNLGVSRLEKSRLGRNDIMRGFRNMGSDIGDCIILKMFQLAI